MRMGKVFRIMLYAITAVPVLYALWLLGRVFVFDYFTVPSSSICLLYTSDAADD